MRKLSKKKKTFLVIIPVILILAFSAYLFIQTHFDRNPVSGLLHFSKEQSDGPEDRDSPVNNADASTDNNSDEKNEITDENTGNNSSANNNTDIKLPDENLETPDIPTYDGQYEANQNSSQLQYTEVLFTELSGNERLYNGCYADIKIRYANGEEYTVIKGVQLIITYNSATAEAINALSEKNTNSENRTESDENSAEIPCSTRVFLRLADMEQLYISSALADFETYEGTTIFPAIYLKKPDDPETTGNYRPSLQIITLMGEEEMAEKDILDRLFLLREKLEERLQESVIVSGTKGNSNMLEGGFQSNATDGYWIYE